MPAIADEEHAAAYDISWPQCPANFPPGSFDFAVIGLNNGRPFTTNDCFWEQYQWARAAEAHPDVYINLDFPKEGRAEALRGPYGRCEETDDWCRGYNWGYNLAKDSVWRTRLWGITPGRYWLDVEVDNHWSDSTRSNAQVVRGVLDFFVDFNIPVGIYGTRYQWGLITGGYEAPGMVIPLWVAGAETADEAYARCDNNTNLAFAGGTIWMAQYYPLGVWDGNVLCPKADRTANHAGQPEPAAERTPAPVASPSRTAAPLTQTPRPAAATPQPSPLSATAVPLPDLTQLSQLWSGKESSVRR